MQDKTDPTIKERISGFRMQIAAGVAAGALLSLGFGLFIYQRRKERERIIAL